MSDKEKLINMFNKAKITFSDVTAFSKPGCSHIIVNRGYVGFSTWFSFNQVGDLQDVEAGE